MSDKFATTEITLTVSMDTQFGWVDAVKLIREHLNFPAVNSVDIKQVLTNYRIHGEHTDEMYEISNIQPNEVLKLRR